MRLRGWVVIAAALVLQPGCKSDTPVRNNLAGRVLLDGQLINDGIVTLHGPDWGEATSSIRADGTYSIDDPPLGDCKITVRDVPGARPGAAEHDPAPEQPRQSRIPFRYEKPENGLHVEVMPGKHSHDIRLTR
jgi:hypothetical protein